MYLLTVRQSVKVFQGPQSNLELSCLNLKENLSTLVIIAVAVRPESLRRALDFLKENNHLYQNVEINMENIGEHPLHVNKINDGDKSNVISQDLSDSKEKRTVTLTDDRCGVSGDGTVMTEKACNEEEEIDDPQNKYWVSVNETCFESYVADYPIEVSSSSANNPETNDDKSLLTQLSGNEVCSIAPGEGKHPVHFMQDRHCRNFRAVASLKKL